MCCWRWFIFLIFFVVTSEASVPELIIVSTVDGYLRGVDVASGNIHWSLKVTDESIPTLVSSSLDQIQIYDEQDGYVRLIPSFKGDSHSKIVMIYCLV